MAWKPKTLANTFGLCTLVWGLSGCQWQGVATTQPVSRAPAQAETAAPTAAPGNPPAEPPAADATPQVATVQRDVEEFVNRFPDSDLTRRLNRTDEPTTVADAAPRTDAVRVTSPDRPRTPSAPTAANATASPKSAGQSSPPPPASPVVEPDARATGIRANAPLSAAAVVRNSTPDTTAAPRIEAIEIAPIRPAAPSEPTPPRAEPNRAVAAAPAAKVRDIEATIAELEKTVAEKPSDFDAAFRLRMLYMAEGMDDRLTAPVAGLDPELGAMVAEMMQTLVAVRDAVRDPLNRSGAAIERAQGLSQRLRRHAPVKIDKVALVTRVNSFGDYEEMSPAEFAAGQPAQIIVYTEVSNFRSDKADDDRFRTLLGEKVEVFDSRGQSVLKQVHDKIPDSSRRLRNDFFLALELPLPETLTAGTYTVKVTVEDKLSATADQGQITFTMTAPKPALSAVRQ